MPAWQVIFILLLVCLILTNKLLSLNTFTVLQLSRRIQLSGILLGPVWRVCPVSPPLLSAEEVVFRGLLRLLLSVSAVTVVASLSVLPVVSTEAASEPAVLWCEWKFELEVDVLRLERVGELIGIDDGSVGGAFATQSSSESSAVRS